MPFQSNITKSKNVPQKEKMKNVDTGALKKNFNNFKTKTNIFYYNI